MKPKNKGEVAEAIILAELLKLGKPVLIPFGACQPYDLAVDLDGKLLRVQCKTGRIKRGAIFFECCSRSAINGVRKDYSGRCDVIAVYCHENKQIYWVPIADVNSTSCSLRIDPMVRNRSRVVWAQDYELAKKL